GDEPDDVGDLVEQVLNFSQDLSHIEGRHIGEPRKQRALQRHYVRPRHAKRSDIRGGQSFEDAGRKDELVVRSRTFKIRLADAGDFTADHFLPRKKFETVSDADFQPAGGEVADGHERTFVGRRPPSPGGEARAGWEVGAPREHELAVEETAVRRFQIQLIRISSLYL